MFALGLFLALICLAQESPTFRFDVSLVRLDAEVTDGTRTLHGFHKEDFDVKDNGQPRHFRYFSQEEVPLDLILLFDIGGRMRPKVERVAVPPNKPFSQLHTGGPAAITPFHPTHN